MSCADPNCVLPAELPAEMVARFAANLSAHGWADGAAALITAINARLGNRQEVLLEVLLAFMQEHVLPELEVLTPGFKARMAADILERFGSDHPIAAKIARELQGQ